MERRLVLGILAITSVAIGLIAGDLQLGVGLLIALAGITAGVIIIEATDRWLALREGSASRR